MTLLINNKEKEIIEELRGEDLSEGKTPNAELDNIYRRFLPKGLVLRCDTFPKIDEEVHL